jgi:hypothetical protein
VVKGCVKWQKETNGQLYLSWRRAWPWRVLGRLEVGKREDGIETRDVGLAGNGDRRRVGLDR